MRWGSILTGTLALAAMEAILTTEHGSRLPEIFAAPGKVARWFIRPDVPLIPDVRSKEVNALQVQLASAYKQAAAFVPAGTGTGAAPGQTAPTTPPRTLPAPPSKPPILAI